MIEMLPWLVMAAGVIVLFLYRYAKWRRQRFDSTFGAKIEGTEVQVSVAGNTPIPERKRARTHDAASVKGDRNVAYSIGDKHDSDVRFRREPRAAARAVPYRKPHDWMPVVISMMVLGSALFVILSNNTYGDAQQKWAFGVVGTIIGYWFKK